MRSKDSSALRDKEKKLLACVLECRNAGVDPSMDAVAYLVRGDTAVERFGYFKTFGCLSSLSKKKAKTNLNALLKKGYLASYTPYPYQERYLVLTEAGEAEANFMLSRKIIRSSKKAAAPLFHERN